MSRFAINTAIGFVWQRQHNQNPLGEKWQKLLKLAEKSQPQTAH